MTDFRIKDDVMPQALSAWNDSPATFKSMAAMAPTFFKVSADVFTAAFHNQRADAQRIAGFKTLADNVAEYTMPKGILNALAKGQTWIEENTISEVKDSEGKVTTAGFTPKLSWSIDYTPATPEVKDKKGKVTTAEVKAIAKLVCSIGGGRGKGKRGVRDFKEGDRKGRISVFNAWKQSGGKDKNGYVIEQTEGGYHVDGRFVKKLGLTKFLLAVHEDSPTIRLMKCYPEMKIGQ